VQRRLEKPRAVALGEECVHAPPRQFVARARVSLQALPLFERLCRFGAAADAGKSVRGHEPKLRRTSRTTRHLGAGAGGIDLCNDLLRKLLSADKRQP
jgi:hypothetical protein